MGNIEDYFHKRVGETITETDLEEFIKKKIPEGLSIEYKNAEKIPYGKSSAFEGDLRKAISSFANSDGGLVFIGIEEEEVEEFNGNHTEKLKTTRPKGISGFSSEKFSKMWLEDTVIRQIRPRITPSVRIVTIITAGGNVMIVDVPQSDNPPHMANEKYFYRANAESRPMEHYQVADLFHRRREVKLTPQINVIMDNFHNITCQIGIINDGKATAKFPALNILTYNLKLKNRTSKSPAHLNDAPVFINIGDEMTMQGTFDFGKVAHIYPYMQTHLDEMTFSFTKGEHGAIIVNVMAENFLTTSYLYLLSVDELLKTYSQRKPMRWDYLKIDTLEDTVGIQEYIRKNQFVSSDNKDLTDGMVVDIFNFIIRHSGPDFREAELSSYMEWKRAEDGCATAIRKETSR